LSWVVRAPDRNLQRAEKKTYTRVRRALWDYEPLRASHAEIYIDVDGDRVRLRGRVRTVPQKLIAAGLVARLEDVGEVENDLIADPEVVRAVADALAEDVRTAPYVLQIDARHGIVGVRGEVPSQEVADAAIALAAGVPLVSSVRNQMTTGGEVFPPAALPRAAAANPAPALPEPVISVPA
jgi:osmotically-inducible protein OsmY